MIDIFATVDVVWYSTHRVQMQYNAGLWRLAPHVIRVPHPALMFGRYSGADEVFAML